MTIKHDTLVDGGALRMAINVLRRAGKNEVAAELEKSAIRNPDANEKECLYAKHIAELELRLQNSEQRWKQANQMSMLYMQEFEKRGLVYVPLLSVEEASFNEEFLKEERSKQERARLDMLVQLAKEAGINIVPRAPFNKRDDEVPLNFVRERKPNNMLFIKRSKQRDVKGNAEMVYGLPFKL